MENKTVRTILWVIGLSLSSTASAGMIATPPNCDVPVPQSAETSTTHALATRTQEIKPASGFCQQGRAGTTNASRERATPYQTKSIQSPTEPNNLWFLGFCALVVLMPLNRKLINELFSNPGY